MVVDEQVMVSTEDDPVVEAGAAAGFPGSEVVGFGPGGWPVAPGEGASAIPGGEGDALSRGEEPLGASDVDDPIIRAEEHGHEAGFADVPLDGADRQSGGLPVDPPAAGPAIEVGEVDVHDDLGAATRQHTIRVGRRSDADEVDDGIHGDLLDRAGIVDQPVRALAFVGVDEPRTAPAG